MAPGYNSSIDLLRESPTRAINRIVEDMRREGIDVILLSAGEPGVPPPAEIRSWLAKALGEESMKLYSYTPSVGFRELRELISLDLKEVDKIDVGTDQIVVTTGGQSAIFSSFSALFSPGDEVILIDPTYFGYWNMIYYFGVRPISVKADEQSFQPNVDAIAENVRRGKTKAIVLVSPDNPTGRLIDRKIAKAIAEIAIDNDVWIIYDEPYKTLIYEGEHVSMYELAPEHSVSLYAFSKDPGIPGWRLGYVYGPQWIIKKIAMMVETTTYNPPSVAQYLAMEYLRRREVRTEHIRRVREVYAKRRDIMVEELSKIPGLRYLKPQGAMFVFVNIEDAYKSCEALELANRLLLEKHVAVVPGEFFGSTKCYVRLSFTRETPERIVEGVRRMREILGL